MRPVVAFRLLAPITVGSALLGASLLTRDTATDRTTTVALRPAVPAAGERPIPSPAGGQHADDAASRDLSLAAVDGSVGHALSQKPGADNRPATRIIIPPTASAPAERTAFASATPVRNAQRNSPPSFDARPGVSILSVQDAVASIDAAIFPIIDRAAIDAAGTQNAPSARTASRAIASPAAALAANAPTVAPADDSWRSVPLITSAMAETFLLSPERIMEDFDASGTISAAPPEPAFVEAELAAAAELPPVALAAAPAIKTQPQIAAASPPLKTADSEAIRMATQALAAPTRLAVALAADTVAAAPPSAATPQADAAAPDLAESKIDTPREPVAAEPLRLAAPSPAPVATRPAAAPPAAAALSPATPPALARQGSRSLDLTPGEQVFPMPDGGPGFTYDDELILQIKVRGIDATDTIIAYGTRDAVYLPLGELAMILDLAIRVSDEGHYASGWFLSEDRTVTVDLRQNRILTRDRAFTIGPGVAQAFEGDLFIRSEALAAILPLDVEPDLRSQSVLLTTREPFPFEERMRREANRQRLAQGGARNATRELWPRAETPWLPLSFPVADLAARVVSDSQRGTRAETDLRVAGDFAWMTAEAYLSATSQDGLVNSLIELGRRDIDGELLGPLKATEFAFGDVATVPMPLGLRGTTGRGAYVTNNPFESFSVFDQVDLRGVLPDGYEVELYRNGVLLGSTAEASNGQYEFLQVPVDYGLNVFRIVFYGPQGQRREEVRRISVGDGRLSPGKLQYTFGAVQNGTNVLGVRGPEFRPGDRYGDLQAVGELAYGISSSLTGVASAAYFEEDGEARWLAGAGVRTGLMGLALRADAGLSDGNGVAAGLGLGGQALGGAFSLSHFEYRGDFVDEVRSFNSDILRRATEFEFNTTLGFASSVIGSVLPVNMRARRVQYADGRSQLAASLRGSARLSGLILSNTFEYAESSAPGASGFRQLAGDFNLATFNRSQTQFRASLGYRILPQLEISQISADVDHAIDQQTVVSASAGYSPLADTVTLGASAIREFDKFTLAFDGQYSPQRSTYAVALRLGLSFGRDPLRRNFFVTSPGQASSGTVALRAFQDLDGDLLYGPGDRALPEVNFAVFNNVAITDADGFARLGDLGNGNPVVVQADPSSLPDIAMAPASRGVEIVPRPGRIHTLDFPIVELSEVEGTVVFADGDSTRGVSGLRLKLRSKADGQEYWTRTERGGYYFYEQVRPGDYEIMIDPAQADRLGVCLDEAGSLVVPSTGTIIEQDLSVKTCA